MRIEPADGGAKLVQSMKPRRFQQVEDPQRLELATDVTSLVFFYFGAHGKTPAEPGWLAEWSGSLPLPMTVSITVSVRQDGRTLSATAVAYLAQR